MHYRKGVKKLQRISNKSYRSEAELQSEAIRVTEDKLSELQRQVFKVTEDKLSELNKTRYESYKSEAIRLTK